MSEESSILHLPPRGEEGPPSLPGWALVQALLFALGRAATVAELSSLTGLRRADLDEELDMLAAALEGHGLMLQRHVDQVQLVTRAEAATAVRRALQPESFGKLSPAAYETLAIVAYRQPVTMAGVEAIRGVNCERVMANLETKGLITEVGRLDSPGHPRQFGTTLRFMQLLGVSSLGELPGVEAQPRPEA